MTNNKFCKKINLAIFDVDGVMTDGKVILSNDDNEAKSFDVKDGLGLVLLQKVGIKIAIITGNESQIVVNRFTSLGVDAEDIFQGQKNKINAYQTLKNKYKLSDNNISYMGDDLPDIIIMTKVGIAASPADCMKMVKKHSDYICKNKGGDGAVREFCDYLLKQFEYCDEINKNYIENGQIK